MKLKALKAAFPYTVPVMTGYLFMGIAFGILLRSKGYHVGWALLMSVTIYAGSMQFVAINLLTTAFDLVAVALMTLLVNARHLFYGLSMLEHFKGMGKLKGYMMFSLTDETFSLFCSAIPPKEVDKKWFNFFIAFLDQSYWVLGSVIGAALGSFIKFETKGIDFVMTALFVVIFIEQWQSNKKHIPAIVGVAATYLCLLVFGLDKFIIPAMGLIVFVLLIFKKPIEGGQGQ